MTGYWIDGKRKLGFAKMKQKQVLVSKGMSANNNNVNPIADAAAAKSIIGKHQAMLELTCFQPATCLQDFLYDEERGWANIFTSEAPAESDGKTTPEALAESYEKAIIDGLQYHRLICGTRSHASSGSHRLGCPGACTVTLESYSAGGEATLTETEAEMLAALYAAREDDLIFGLPYSADGILQLLEHAATGGK